MASRLFMAASSLGALVASEAAAQTAVQWAKAPTIRDMAAVYPAKAQAAGVGGDVLLSCTVRHTGALTGCAAIDEIPTGYEFGAAARRLAGDMRAAPGFGGREARLRVSFAPEVLGSSPPLLTKPVWAALPTAAEFQTTFPKTENGVNRVRIALACEVRAGGVLTDCAIQSEEPAGQGYGAGALALASKFRVEAWTADGKPTTGARVLVPIRYELTPVAAASR